MKKCSLLLLLTALLIISCKHADSVGEIIESPNGKIQVTFQVSDKGKPFYRVNHNSAIVVDSSYLAFEFTDVAPISDSLKIIEVNKSKFNETWEMPWGEQREVVNHYNELHISLQETSELQRKLNVVFKLYDDGVGFRYEFPEQDNWDVALIKDEHTEFNLTEDYKTFWIPGDWDIYEHLYSTTKLSEIDAKSYIPKTNLAQTYIPENAVNTPVTMVGKNGLHLSFHEAALVDYSGMTLKVDTSNLNLKSDLVGSENTEYKVKRSLPFNTPWRTIQITDNAPDLIESNLIVNLNEPNKLGDVSWF